MKKKKLKKRSLLSLITLIFSVAFLIYLVIINLLPLKYYLIVIACVIVFYLLFLMLNKKNKKIVIFNIIYLIIMSLLMYYFNITFKTLNSFQDSNQLSTYLVVTLKENKFKLQDLDELTIGYYLDDNIDKVNKKINSLIDFNIREFSDENVLKSLSSGDISGLIIDKKYYDIFQTNKDDFEIIYQFDLVNELAKLEKYVNVSKQPFIIYISGIDVYGSINNSSRSDVNILLVVNPVTKEVLLINTPRDTYTMLGDTGSYDKLTHAGILGIESSIKSLENLYKVDINYFFKVNFTSLIQIVDSLGGIDVNSEYDFNLYGGGHIDKGNNHLDGTKALAFARTRKSFTEGDKVRGMNQMEVIKAIIKKVTNKSILTKYTSLLNSLNGRIQTNMPVSDMTKLVKMQLSDMATWNLNSLGLDGYDDLKYGYFYPNQRLYMMVPYEDSLKNITTKINSMLKGEKLGDVNEVVTSSVIDDPSNHPSLNNVTVNTKEIELTKEVQTIEMVEKIELTKEIQTIEITSEVLTKQ